jgi:riboflavin kinase / FMN adenylyltransferase
VYAVELKISDSADTTYKGMMNIGTRPTVDGTKQVTEVNIFDFDRDIYGETVTVYLGQHLRSEVKFSGLKELKEQLGRDKLAALQLNSG